MPATTRRRLLASSALLGSAIALRGRTRPVSAAAPNYRITLVTPDGESGFGEFATPYGINEKGVVVGDWRSENLVHAMFFRKGKFSLLGDTSVFSSARAVTAGRATAGYVVDATSTVATVWQDGETRELPPIAGSIAEAWASSGETTFVGRSSIGAAADSPIHACFWQDGAVTDLGSLGGNSAAWAINEAGDIVGSSALDAGSRTSIARGDFPSGEHAVLWRGGEIEDLGTLDGTASTAAAINASGQIVGNWTTTAGEIHGFLYDNGTMSDLGSTSGVAFSTAVGINASGAIVGSASNPDADQAIGQPHVGVIWIDGELYDLNMLIPPDTFFVESAYAINDAGQIAASGNIVYPEGFGAYSGALLTPIKE